MMSGLLSTANPPADAGTCVVKSETVSAAAPRMPKIGWISFSRYRIGSIRPYPDQFVFCHIWESSSCVSGASAA